MLDLHYLQAVDEEKDGSIIGVIVGKLDRHRRENKMRGYIAMLAVDKNYRKRRIGMGVRHKTKKRILLNTLYRCYSGKSSCG
jgi:GNAT superfamily N-acetyltransferase